MLYQQVQPVKQYFYLAVGIPVLSAKIKMMASKKPYIITYDDNQQLVRLIRERSSFSFSPQQKRFIAEECMSETIEKKALDLQLVMCCSND